MIMEAGSGSAAAPHSAAPATPGDAVAPESLIGKSLNPSSKKGGGYKSRSKQRSASVSTSQGPYNVDLNDFQLQDNPHSPEEEEEEEDEKERRPKAAERAGWEDAIALMARSAAVLPELSADSSLRSCTSTASMKVKNVKKLTLTKGHFPRLAECAHFHYENVDFGSVQLSLTEGQNDLTHNALNSKELVYFVKISCQGKKWTVRRSYEDFRVLDKHLHLCIYDRRFSRLTELPRFDSVKDRSEPLCPMLTAYLSRLSTIADNKINCGPVLTWMEIDNKGNHLLVHDESSINVPAVAAAHVIKRYIAQAADELSFEVGDIVSVIDMPPKEDTGWWRGKHGFQVGFFPSECVEIISEKIPANVTNSLPKPVSNKHGKLITLMRTFMKSRPSKQKLKQRGILRERVFGCDLGEHLLNSGHHVPQVIKSCTEFIEKHGVVDGIYRLSGISSNIQKLRHEFDSEHMPDLTRDTYIQDIHSVGSLCKLYFRELPNPLLTYQLYEKFSEAVSAATDDERLVKIHDVIQQLPPPHYRTLEFLMRHMAHMATFSHITNMHCKNLAIVWAPNLLRSRQIESACFGGTSAFMEVRIQSVVVEFILNHVDVLFSPKLSTLIRESTGPSSISRPKSLLVCSPSAKLLSLEEAQARTQAQPTSPVSPGSKYIEVGEGPGALQGKFHTIIEFPMERKKAQTKVKKSPVASWRSFFSMAKSSTTSKRKLLRHPSEPNEIKTLALPGGRGDTGTLRSAKSEESLSSHHPEGSAVHQARRPRSTSDALSASYNEELLNSRGHKASRDSRKDPAVSVTCVSALISTPQSADANLSMAPLDFEQMMFPSSEAALNEGGKTGSRKKNRGSSSKREPLNKVTSPADSKTDRENANHRNSVSAKFTPSTIAKKEPDSSEPAPTLVVGPTQNPEVPSEKKGLPVSPTEAIKASESTWGDECQQRPSSLLQAESESRDKTPNEQARPATQSETGAVTFDCTPGLVRSVSLITSQPAVKNAARMLALELAESAQQATSLKKRGSSEPPTPVSPVHLHDPLSRMQWPPPPSYRPQTSSAGREGVCGTSKPYGNPSSTISTGSYTDAGSLQSTCACHGSESGLSYSDGGEASAESHVSFAKGLNTAHVTEGHKGVRENVRHVGVGTDSASPGDSSQMEAYESPKPSPSQAERFSAHQSSESQSAMAALLSKQAADGAASACNFRVILTEASVPASVQDVLPHAPVSPLTSVHQCSPKNEPRPSGYIYWKGPLEKGSPFQPDYGQQQAKIIAKDYHNTLAPRSLHQSIKYKSLRRDEYSPRYFYRHGGPRYPPMDGASVYPTIRRVRSMHTPPEDKFFFSPQPSYQHNTYQRPLTSDFHQVHPYFEDGKVQYRCKPYSGAQQSNLGHYQVSTRDRYRHSYTLRKPSLHPERVMTFNNIESLNDPHINLPFSREASFISHGVSPLSRTRTGALHKGLSDPFFSVSARQGNVGKMKMQDSVQPKSIGSQRCQETMHTRSKLDSGKDLLISTEGADGKYRITMVSHYSPDHPLSDPDISLPIETERKGSRHSSKPAPMLRQSQSMQNYPQHTLESQPRPRHLTLHKEYSCPDFKHTDSFELDSAQVHSQNKLMNQSLSSYPKEGYQHAWVKGHELQWLERSQGTKRQAKMTPEHDHRLSCPVQSRPRTRSMFVRSCSNYTDRHVSMQPNVPAMFSNYGCKPHQRSRFYTTSMGTGSFLHSKLRPETEIYAE